jgi:(S)-ureidoglycine aminohydrolase
MQHLGKTRSAHYPNHLLQTPDTFVRAPLPGMRKATAIVHIGPAGGARFTQYTVEFDAGGTMEPASVQRFLYVLDGELSAGERSLASGEYAYFPPNSKEILSAARPVRVAVIEKPYEVLAGVATSAFFTGKESAIPGQPFLGDDALHVRALIPADPAFDFMMTTMTFQPGATLPMVEIHVMEHGLLMLAGEGIYRLGEYWYPVAAGDFIWMAPYCPQWFGALGKTPAKYLLYKDWNRHPLSDQACD